jgi:hypothetical protein
MSSLTQTIANVLIKNRDYRSETTNFINELKTARPELEAQQRHGRALLWDKNVDLTEQADNRAAQVKQKAYVYGTNP